MTIKEPENFEFSDPKKSIFERFNVIKKIIIRKLSQSLGKHICEEKLEKKIEKLPLA